MSDQQEIPTLLMGYTYFLNNRHNSYINIGFDSYTLDRRIILFKNHQFMDLPQAEWNTLINNRQAISEFFYNNQITEIVAEKNAQVLWKLCRRKEGRTLTAVHSSSKRITISAEEWLPLNAFINFLNAVNNWATEFQQYLKSYYSEYLRKCLSSGMLHLPADKFFMINMYNVTCNYSRLFAELPIISKIRLSADFHAASAYDTTG